MQTQADTSTPPINDRSGATGQPSRPGRWLRRGIGLAIVFGLLWWITAAWGVADVRSFELAKHNPSATVFAIDPRVMCKLDPQFEPPTNRWYFVDQGTAVFPFVVRIETITGWGWKMLPNQDYYVWAFGAKFDVESPYPSVTKLQSLEN